MNYNRLVEISRPRSEKFDLKQLNLDNQTKSDIDTESLEDTVIVNNRKKPNTVVTSVKDTNKNNMKPPINTKQNLIVEDEIKEDEIINTPKIEPMVDSQVRSSLMLLKTKTRTRRSIIATQLTQSQEREHESDHENETERNDFKSNKTNKDLQPIENKGSNYNFDELEGSLPVETGPLYECPDCLRNFNEVPFHKHIKICAKVFQEKRKAFNSAQQRLEANPETKQILKSKNKSKNSNDNNYNIKTEAANTNTTSVPKWKSDSEAFRNAMKSARDIKVAQETGKPLPQYVSSAPDPSLVECPHCQRRFNAKAAERHIPVCNNIRAKPTSLKRGTGGGAALGNTTKRF